MSKEEKPKPTRAELEAEAVRHTKRIQALSEEIDKLTKERSSETRSLRAIHGQIVTIDLKNKA